MSFVKKLAQAANEKKSFSSLGEFLADIMETVECDCGYQFDSQKLRLQKVVMCPDCGSEYNSYIYDDKLVKKMSKKVKLPSNCLYDFADGIFPCLSMSTYCKRECYYRKDQVYSFVNGACSICGAGKDHDGYCENGCGE